MPRWSTALQTDRGQPAAGALHGARGADRQARSRTSSACRRSGVPLHPGRAELDGLCPATTRPLPAHSRTTSPGRWPHSAAALPQRRATSRTSPSSPYGVFPGIPFFVDGVPAFLQVQDRDVILARSDVAATHRVRLPCDLRIRGRLQLRVVDLPLGGATVPSSAASSAWTRRSTAGLPLLQHPPRGAVNPLGPRRDVQAAQAYELHRIDGAGNDAARSAADRGRRHQLLAQRRDRRAVAAHVPAVRSRRDSSRRLDRRPGAATRAMSCCQLVGYLLQDEDLGNFKSAHTSDRPHLLAETAAARSKDAGCSANRGRQDPADGIAACGRRTTPRSRRRLQY